MEELCSVQRNENAEENVVERFFSDLLQRFVHIFNKIHRD